MDAKITKKRLGIMLSYDWFKIVLAAAGLIIVWMLVFNMTATRIKSSQDFTIANYVGNASISTELSNTLVKAKDDGALSYEVIEIGMEDIAANGSSASQLLEARTATDEIDLLFASTQPYEGYTYELDGETYTRSYLEVFLGGYFYQLHNFGEGGYFDQMAAYLNGYYGDYTAPDAVLNTEKVEQDFRARAKGDKRYKTAKQKEAGLQGEIERIEKYRASLIKFNAYLASGWVSLTKSTYLYSNDEGEPMQDLLKDKGYYAINICPDTMPEEMRVKLSKIVGYYPVDEEGKEGAKTASNMQVCLFDSNGKQEAYRYEALNYICYLLDSLQA